MITLNELVLYANQALEIEKYNDYCPNGLQVQGRAKITRLAAGVTASLSLIDAAIRWGADALLVHHGFFWRNETPVITGMKHNRLKSILLADMSLLAYHLPLDSHPQWGNNVQLANLLGIEVTGPLNSADPKVPGLQGVAPERSIGEWATVIEQLLGRAPLIIDAHKPVRRLGWCTGAGQNFIDMAAAEGLDLYISGEASEPTYHSAVEQNIGYLGVGHHASERLGVQALGAHLAQTFDLEFKYIECPNPI